MISRELKIQTRSMKCCLEMYRMTVLQDRVQIFSDGMSTIMVDIINVTVYNRINVCPVNYHLEYLPV